MQSFQIGTFASSLLTGGFFYAYLLIFPINFHVIITKNWIDFFSLPDMWRVFRNTLVISGLSMTIGFVMPIVFALLLNEIHHTVFKKAIQTISYLPYFIS